MVSDGTHLRGEFLLDQSVTFLNHGSFGATPRAVFERYQEWQRELERQPVLFLARRLDALLAEARAELGAYVGADPDDLVFVPNATAGVNVAAWPLGLKQGDEVLSTDLEYDALDLTWEHVCGDFGARYVRTPIRLPVTSADEIVEAVWAGVGPRTRALFLSHHTSSTAMTLPVRELCRRAREAGIRTIVDGAHVPGHLPLNLRELDADYYAGNCHKWQLRFSRYRLPERTSDAGARRGRSRPSPQACGCQNRAVGHAIEQSRPGGKP
jgi:isopenicillin-N epimerase